jgi:hypothetical protein
MPVAVLLVEGELDEQVLVSWKPPRMTVERGGPKGSLQPATRDRRKKVVDTYYLRDRDFDFEPPDDLTRPTADSALGFRWCRHEIENYLLEPALVAQAVPSYQSTYTEALLAAGQTLRHYTAARWVMGTVRRSLPPLRELPTRPTELSNEIKLPTHCSEASCDAWAHELAESFLQRITPVLGRDAISAMLTERKQRLVSLQKPEDVLLWHSGKDLLAALGPSLPGRFKNHPKVFLNELRDWVRAHPEPSLELIAEWKALRGLLL